VELPHSFFLDRLRDDLSPSAAENDRVRKRIERHIAEPQVLRQAMREATPTMEQRSMLWARIHERIESPAALGVFDRLRTLLTPESPDVMQGKPMLFSRLRPVSVPTTSTSYRLSKWAAAFVLVVMALRMSPVLFLAPLSVAQSSVIVIPTQGTVSLALHDLWQPLTEQVELADAVSLMTNRGEATVLFHDDGTVRLGQHTRMTLHDLTNRPEPAIAGSTMSLESGHVWLQGLLPQYLRGLSIITEAGEAVVNGGSVSLAVQDDDSVLVRVWDRHAVVVFEGEEYVLVAGEKTVLRPGKDIRILPIENGEFDEAWVMQNLKRDAVHQREIAQMQQERRAARAGILPTSPLYPVKRVAEKMDVLLTLNPEQ
jgi:hypothetical protein